MVLSPWLACTLTQVQPPAPRQETKNNKEIIHRPLILVLTLYSSETLSAIASVIEYDW